MKSISLPFRIDGYGKVVTTTDPSKVWADRAKTAITTPVGTRIMRPSYGTSVPLQLFNNTDDGAISFEADVSAVFTKWLPDLEFRGVGVTESPDTAEVFVEVSYATPNDIATDQVTVVVEY